MSETRVRMSSENSHIMTLSILFSTTTSSLFMV